MILNKAQAQAVYDAMCELNNVGGLLHCRINKDAAAWIHVKEHMTDEINVWVGLAGATEWHPSQPFERFRNQNHFANDYAVNQRP